jgi:hypothetical protein
VIRAAALVAAVFGVLTIVSGGRVLFGDGAAAAGSYVPYIVWFNFVAGFAYVAAAIGLWLRRPWAAGLAAARGSGCTSPRSRSRSTSFAR